MAETTTTDVPLEVAQANYYAFSGQINNEGTKIGRFNTVSKCDRWKAAVQVFVDALKATSWPAAAQPQINESVSANEYLLFTYNDLCVPSDPDASSRATRAAFETRKALGLPTDFG